MQDSSDGVKISGYGRFFEAYGNGGGSVRVEHGSADSNELLELDAATEERGVEMAVLNFFYNLFLKVALSKIRSLGEDKDVVDLTDRYFEIVYKSAHIAAKLILTAAIAGEIEEVDINRELATKALSLFDSNDPILKKIFAAALNDAQVRYLQGLVRARWTGP